MIHELKTHQPFFDAIAEGRKTFEVRKNDRGFQVGDKLVLLMFDRVKSVHVCRWRAQVIGIQGRANRCARHLRAFGVGHRARLCVPRNRGAAMTASEIQQRVDAWLEARSAWLGQDDARWSLASQWQAVSRQFGADSPAALGVLLGLVRAAHGHPFTNACQTSDGRFWGVRCPGYSAHMGIGRSEGEALVRAMEAAP